MRERALRHLGLQVLAWLAEGVNSRMHCSQDLRFRSVGQRLFMVTL